MAQGVTGFDRHFAGAHDVDIIPGGGVVGLGGSFSEFIKEVLQDGEGRLTPAESGDGPHEERVGAEEFDFKSHQFEFVEMVGKKGGHAALDWEGDGFEESLPFNGGCAPGIAQHFVEDAFVGNVLINDEKAVVIFGQDESLVNLTEDPETIEKIGEVLGIGVGCFRVQGGGLGSIQWGLGGDGKAGQIKRNARLGVGVEGFVDGGDIGERWNHAVAEERVFNSPADCIKYSTFAVEFDF